jgi:hypothetical protein
VKGQVQVELAGKKKTMDISYHCTETSPQHIRLQGCKNMNFSDFELKPPRKIGGLIRINEDIKVNFNLFFQKTQFLTQIFSNMKKAASAVIVSGIILLLVSFGLLYSMIAIFPTQAEEYFQPVFRWSDAGTDWMFYAHPFVLSIALKWFWERYKEILPGGLVLKALELAFVYGIVAMLPVLWLTFQCY